MKKLFGWCKENVLFLFSLFLLAFIPLYPKLPLLDVKNTWVYVRLEDFVVLFVILAWGIMVIRHKLSLKTPLTIPIFVFWIVGAIATIHGMLIIYPQLADIFPNVAYLSFLRRIEYIVLFFISYMGMKDKSLLRYVVIVLTGTTLAVIGYGIGQKYLGFPAYLTMNEEFAKGVAIQLSALSRVSSTFAGHYDLAAYLVLVIPIIVSLMFGYKNWIIRALFLATSVTGTVVLFMTVSRISFFALFVSLGLVLFFQRKKLIILSLPVVAIFVTLLLIFFPSMVQRFGNTVKEIDVLVDQKTGNALGQVKEVPNTYFQDKVIKQQFISSIAAYNPQASPSANIIVPYTLLPQTVALFIEPNAPTGENLPQGTGYINLPLSTIIHRISIFLYERKPDPATGTKDTIIVNGDYLIKRALAYDLSFTTRFQGEWPHALTAFERNILFGSGYGSVSMAVDNSYLRTLGEVGILGFVSFLAIFISIGIYLRKALPNMESGPQKSFIYGFIAGLVGLGINAIFIDVFESSKIAFSLWLLTGVTVGLSRFFQNVPLSMARELKRVIFSKYAIMVYLFVTTFLLFSPLLRNFFVGDDFTWFRWAADCGSQMGIAQKCSFSYQTIVSYFTQANGFFYRPGAKTYFLFMYSVFWLNQNVYHLVSISLHFLVSVLVFLLAKKIFKNNLLSALAGFLFLILSGYSEAVFWISATGFLFTTVFSLASLLCYIHWVESKKKIYFIGTLGFFVLSPLFHELGIVTPLLFLLYHWVFIEPVHLKNVWKNIYYQILLLPVPIYLFLRYMAHSHWLSGDYNYSLLKFPFNAVGNAIGYFFLIVGGPLTEPLYLNLRTTMKDHVLIALVTTSIAIILAILV